MPVVPTFRVTFASSLRTGERASRHCGPTSKDTVLDGSEKAEAALRSSSLVGRSNITKDCAAGAPRVCASLVIVIFGLADGGCSPNGAGGAVLTTSLGPAPCSVGGFATNQSLLASLVGNPGLSLGE